MTDTNREPSHKTVVRQPAILRSLRRIALAVLLVIAIVAGGYLLWTPGLDVRDGRHDRGSNAIWLAHGWIGADEWFFKNGKTNQLDRYRSSAAVHALAAKLGQNGIRDVFPHLCPAGPTGEIPAVSPTHTEQFLDAFEGFRVLPWIGGPNGSSVMLENPRWRSNFVAHVKALLNAHPRLAGVHLNIEPLPNGTKEFLQLLEELKTALPPGKLFSVAAYPPPTRWHPFPDVHWEEAYFREVARRCDQMAVMMYDAAQHVPKTYQRLMADWTGEVLDWSEGRNVLLGVPTYDDAGVGYHDPKVENLPNALLGVHRGLSRKRLPSNYQGLAVYCEWETSEMEWTYFREHFLVR